MQKPYQQLNYKHSIELRKVISKNRKIETNIVEMFLKSRIFDSSFRKFFKIGINVEIDDRIEKFIEETERRLDYYEHIDDWNNLDPGAQHNELRKDGWIVSYKSAEKGKTTF